MENLRQAVIAKILALVVCVAAPNAGYARALDRVIPGLFGGSLSTFIDPRAGQDAQRPRIVDRFKGLSASVASARSQVPLPSASGSFQYTWDDDADTFVRANATLGSLVAERGQTLGRGVLAWSSSYTHVDFDTFDGTPLSRLQSEQSAISAALLDRLPAGDRARAEDDLLRTALDVQLALDLLSFGVAYGLTSDIDVSLLATVNRARIQVRGESSIGDPDGDGGAFFTVDQPGVVVASSVDCPVSFRCAHDSVDEVSAGTGDVYLRAKWRAFSIGGSDVAIAGILSVPTGNAGDLLGFHDPSFTPWLIVSRQWSWVSPHLNAGYAIRSSRDIRQAQWIAGVDVAPTQSVTIATDVVGQHGASGGEHDDDVYQGSFGAKAAVWGGSVVALGIQVPLNREGLRADVIYTVQVEVALQ